MSRSGPFSSFLLRYLATTPTLYCHVTRINSSKKGDRIMSKILIGKAKLGEERRKRERGRGRTEEEREF